MVKCVLTEPFTVTNVTVSPLSFDDVSFISTRCIPWNLHTQTYQKINVNFWRIKIVFVSTDFTNKTPQSSYYLASHTQTLFTWLMVRAVYVNTGVLVSTASAIKKLFTYFVLQGKRLNINGVYFHPNSDTIARDQGPFDVSCSEQAQALLGQSQDSLLWLLGLWLVEHSLSLLRARDRKQALV